MIITAQKNFKIYVIENKLQLDDIYNQPDLNVGEIDNIGHEIENLRLTIVNLIGFDVVFNETKIIQKNIKETELRLFKERVRIMEIFGVFVAVFAFIFSTIQYTRTYNLIDSISILSAMGLILIVFLSVLHLVLHKDERTLAFIIITIILILITLLVIPLAPKILYKII